MTNQSIRQHRGTVAESVVQLVLQGMEDTVAPVENSEQLRQEYGERIMVVDVPKAGHALLPEQPELIAKAILGFLRR